VNETLQHVGFSTLPYHCYLPSFGEWGFIMVGHQPIPTTLTKEVNDLSFINRETFRQLTYFPPDMSKVPSPINTLNEQLLVQTFEREWSHFTQ
jgi:spermidine synthase